VVVFQKVSEEFNDLNGWGFMNWSVTKWCSFEQSDFKIILHDGVSKTCYSGHLIVSCWRFVVQMFMGIRHLELLSDDLID
jgi:hypothetical protein